MTQNELSTELAALPSEAQNQVADFVAFLRQKYQTRRAAPPNPKDLETEPFVGIWSDRADWPESTDWVRQTRRNEWGES